MFAKSVSLFIALLLCVAPVFAMAEESEDIFFGPFEAEILNGDGMLTEAYFENAEYTFINFWATWCPPCIDELPALAQLNAETTGAVQVLGVLIDAMDDAELRDEEAIEMMHVLLQGANAEYPVIYPESEIIAEILFQIQSIPTTVVVDKEGKIINVAVGGRSLSQWLEFAGTLPAGAPDAA